MLNNLLLLYALPILIGWTLDLLLGDPSWLPHPVVLFGKAIAFFEKKLNKGGRRVAKGAFTAFFLIAITILLFWAIDYFSVKLHIICVIIVRSLFIFLFLAGTTLIREVRDVFKAVDRSLEEGRKQVARIVGRDTSELSAQEIRTAALETLAENLSDGVVAPLFWLMVGGLPAMAAYKMANTLDSMIGYKTERYKDFGRFAAKTDDVLNWIPARLTAFLMALVSGESRSFRFMPAQTAAILNPPWPESWTPGSAERTPILEKWWKNRILGKIRGSWTLPI